MQTTKQIEHYGNVLVWNIADKNICKYRCQWVTNDGRYNHISRTKTLYAESLQACKDKALKLYGRYPDKIHRI